MAVVQQQVFFALQADNPGFNLWLFQVSLEKIQLPFPFPYVKSALWNLGQTLGGPGHLVLPRQEML